MVASSIKSNVSDLLADVRPKLEKSSAGRNFLAAAEGIIRHGLPTLVPLLPCLLQLNGEPFTLDYHFPFESFYKTHLSNTTSVKAGRQIGKSVTLAAQGIMLTTSIPYFNTLYVTPLYEMVRRFSNNYVKRFIDESPFRDIWTNSTTSSNVLQRSFRNNSSMFFSYAFMNADRTRGIPAAMVGYDEVQDLDPTFVPIIDETLSGSKYGLRLFAGTPKTFNNTLQRACWELSSQAEWMVPCLRCNYDNYPSLDMDLDAMIGPWRSDISVHNPGVICAKCKRPVDPALGRWMHRYPERMADHAGYHMPQIIFPLHYGDQDKWAKLLSKREGRFNTGVNVFYNEVCGESYDTSAKLVSLSDLKRAAILPWKNELEAARKHIHEYPIRILSADWGGGGKQGVSWTVFTIMGRKDDGQIDVLYSFRSMTPHDADREGKILCDLLNQFKCHYFVHDFNGAGRYREQVAVQAGFPVEKIAPIWYVPSMAQAIMKFVPVSEHNARPLFRLDKPRSLVITCSQIRQRRIRFFQYDNYGPENPGVLDDFMSLIEDKLDSRLGRDVYTIIHEHGKPDDFAHTVNMGACFFYNMFNCWPIVGETARFSIDSELLEELEREPTWRN